MATAAALLLSGQAVQARDFYSNPFDNHDRDRDHDHDHDHDHGRPSYSMPAAPEVASWAIGAGVLGLLTVGFLRRKSAKKKLGASN